MASELIVTPGDLREAGFQTGNLAPCPFCGKKYPLTLTKHNPDTAIYRTEVNCSDWRCGANVGSNSRDMAEARRDAIAKWNRRISHPSPPESAVENESKNPGETP